MFKELPTLLFTQRQIYDCCAVFLPNKQYIKMVVYDDEHEDKDEQYMLVTVYCEFFLVRPDCYKNGYARKVFE